MDDNVIKPLEFIGSSRKDLRAMPDAVRQAFGSALFLAQGGEKSDKAKPLKGFHGAGVLEIIEDYVTDTYRAVYTVRFAEVIYVLHVFQKKSRSGIATPTHDLELIAKRLKTAEKEYEERKRNR